MDLMQPSKQSRRQTLKLIASTPFIASAGTAHAFSGNPLRVGGTGSANELLNALGREFQKLAPNARLSLVPGLGSGGGIQATRDNALDLSVSGRPLKPEELGPLVAVHFARSPFVFATSLAKPAAQASSQLARMIADPTAKWPDGTPLRVILRPRAESDTGLVARHYPEIGKAVDLARKRPEVPVAVNDQDNATMAERLQGSLIGISLVQLTLEKRNLRPLQLDGKAPTLANLERGQYQVARDFYLVHAAEPSSDVRSFVAFIRSPDGAKVLRTCECLAVA